MRIKYLLVKISCLLQPKILVAYESIEIGDDVFGWLFNNILLLTLIDNKIFVGEELGKDIKSLTSQNISCLQKRWNLWWCV